MVKVYALAALLGATGCKASLAGGDDVQGTIDARGSANIDGAVQADAPPACANGRRVYLEFEGGITLTKDTASDALTNKARWLTNASSDVPQWRAGSGTRATEKQEVIDGVKARLMGTPIEIVTTRPASGSYVMILFGGQNLGNGGTVGSAYGYSVNGHDCGDATKNDVGWLSNMTPESTSYIANTAVGSIGWGLGLDGTLTQADCMCGWGSSCAALDTPCTLSQGIATSVTAANETACNATQNEMTAFATGFCQ